MRSPGAVRSAQLPKALDLLRFAGCVFLAAAAFAQTFSGSISGVVNDPTGAVVTNALVRLKNLSTNDTREFKSLEDGTYKFDNLNPGNYELTAEAAGFQRYVQTGMILRAGTAANVNIALRIGETGQNIEVSDQAVLLDTESATRTATIESRLIQSLPNNTRNPFNFVFALAGTTEAQGGMTSRAATTDQMFSMFGLQGGRTGNAQILIDGTPSTAPDWGGLIVSPLVDSTQEMQVVQNTYDAQYPKSGAGIVALITKSGSNQFHGTAFDYLRNSALDANRWSNNRNSVPKGQFKRNQFGGNISGPILKRANLFFFAGYEALRQPETGASGLQTVPTALQRSGDFSQTFNPDGTLAVIYNPFSTRLTTDASGNQVYTRDPFPGNIIPQNLQNPVGQRIINLYPSPNRPADGANQINNFFAQGPGRTTNDKVDWRVDWAQSQMNRLFVRMSQRIRQDYNPACFYCNGADPNYSTSNPGYQITLSDTVTPSPTWVINALVGYGRWQEAQTSLSYGVADAATLGLNPTEFQAPVIPAFDIQNYGSLGNNTFRRLTRYSTTAQVNVTKEFSRHSLKFGANYDVQLMNNTDETAGNFSFDRALTSCDPTEDGSVCAAQLTGSNFTGNGIASLLLGTGAGNTEFRPDKAMSLHNYGAYIQDAWRVTNRLTITAGLRYENQRPATERYNRLAYFNFQAVNPLNDAVAPGLGRPLLGGFEYASASNRYAWPTSDLNFAPRVGVAYKVTDRLVARAGFGIFYLPTVAMISYDDPGQHLGFTADTPFLGTVNGLGYVPQNLISNPFPTGINTPVGSSQGLLTYTGLGVGQAWPKAPHPVGYTEQWSFDLQYQIGSHAAVEAGYTGWRGRKMMYGNPNINANQLPTEYLALRDQLNAEVPNPFYGIITDPNSSLNGPTVLYNQLLRPYPQYSYLQWTRSLPGASAQFDALNLKYTHAFSNGLSLLSSYQFSKAMDNGSEDYIGWTTGNRWRDSYNTRIDYAISAHDVPHSFATAVVYDLPFGRGRKWGSGLSGFMNQAFGNWQASFTIRVSSGLPLFPVFVNYSNPLEAYGFPGYQVPNLVGNPRPSNQNPNGWINAAAFQIPDQYTIGNTAPYLSRLRESATKNVDLSVAKDFGGERFKIQFRGEFLNLFNHPIFGGNYNYSVCLECGDFGTMYDTRNDPRNIQFSLRAMF